jgi:hypothetical protein
MRYQPMIKIKVKLATQFIKIIFIFFRDANTEMEGHGAPRAGSGTDLEKRTCWHLRGHLKSTAQERRSDKKLCVECADNDHHRSSIEH